MLDQRVRNTNLKELHNSFFLYTKSTLFNISFAHSSIAGAQTEPAESLKITRQRIRILSLKNHILMATNLASYFSFIHATSGHLNIIRIDIFFNKRYMIRGLQLFVCPLIMHLNLSREQNSSCLQLDKSPYRFPIRKRNRPQLDHTLIFRHPFAHLQSTLVLSLGLNTAIAVCLYLFLSFPKRDFAASAFCCYCRIILIAKIQKIKYHVSS